MTDTRPSGEAPSRPRSSPRISAGTLNKPIIDRTEFASKVSDFVLQARGSVVLLHGKPASGKTELLRRWVIPRLRAAAGQRGVFYGSCHPRPPSVLESASGPVEWETALARGGIIILDDFGRTFDLGRDERQAVVQKLFARMGGQGRGSVLVVVTDTRYLTNVYALAADAPDIANEVLELEAVGITEGLDQLGGAQESAGPLYTGNARMALQKEAAELEERGWDPGFDLFCLLDARLQHLATELGKPSVDEADFRKVGGIRGMLRAHLEETFHMLEIEGAEDLGITGAILAATLEARGHSRMVELDEIARRFAAPPGVVESVFQKLASPGGVLRSVGNQTNALKERRWEFVPLQLGAVIEENVADEMRQAARIYRIVEEGLRSWSRLGNLLSRERFGEVHGARQGLTLGAEAVRFLLQCALGHEDSQLAGASSYWLRRMADRDDALNLLMASLHADAVAMRTHAAALLRDFPSDDARERLRIVTLTDPNRGVRLQAAASLGAPGMVTEQVEQLLVEEAGDGKSAHRLQAIEALGCLPASRVAGALQRVVNDPEAARELRDAAISVLATLETVETADALLDIALKDPDKDDREAAAKALARTDSVALSRHTLSRLRVAVPSMVFYRLSRAGLGVLGIVGGVAVFMLLGSLAIEDEPGWFALLLFTPFLLLLPTTKLLKGLREGKFPIGSPAGVLTVALYGLGAISVFFWVHGLAHFITRRKWKGFNFFTWQLFALMLVFVIAQVTDALPGLFDWLQVVYLLIGGLLFVGSYYYDVIGVLFDSLLTKDAVGPGRRSPLVYQQILSNPPAARVVLDSLASGIVADARWATSLLRRYGATVAPAELIADLGTAPPDRTRVIAGALRDAKSEDTVRQLESLWTRADSRLRRTIAQVLYLRPNQRSVEALERLSADGGFLLKLRARIAEWHFRFSVWPREIRFLSVVLLPFVAVLGYHGYKVFTNPAHGQVITLRMSRAIEENMIKATTLMASHYPRETAEPLLDVFAERKHAGHPTVHGAIALALVAVDSVLADGGPLSSADSSREVAQTIALRARIRDELRTQTLYFDIHLPWDSQAVKVLGAIGGIQDATLAHSALRLLVDFVLGRSGSSGPADRNPVWLGGLTRERGGPETASDSLLQDQRRRAIAALGSVRPDRSLQTLNRLDREAGQGPLGTDIRRQIDIASRAAFAHLRQRSQYLPPDSVRAEGEQLLAMLRQLRRTPGGVRDSITRLVAAARACDKTSDGLCDEADKVVESIDRTPDEETGYRSLLDHYASASNYGGARAQFSTLRGRHRTSVWPRKILAEIDHEYLIRGDTSFRWSYEEMVALRNLPSYAALPEYEQHRFTADFAEIALSAGEYDETERIAASLGARSSEAHHRLNMALFVYFARVMKGDRLAASGALDSLESVVSTLPEPFYNNWIYPGTNHFIDQSGLPQDLREALLALCRGGAWYSQQEAKKIIQVNREALARLGSPGG